MCSQIIVNFSKERTARCLALLCSPVMTDKLISTFHQLFFPHTEILMQLFHTEILRGSHDLPQFSTILNLPRHAKIYNLHITKRIDAAQQNVLRLEQKKILSSQNTNCKKNNSNISVCCFFIYIAEFYFQDVILSLVHCFLIFAMYLPNYYNYHNIKLKKKY